MANEFLDKNGLAHLWGKIKTLVSSKQDELKWDSVPTKNSTNPVTSHGIYTALQNAGGGGGGGDSGGGGNGTVYVTGDFYQTDMYIRDISHQYDAIADLLSQGNDVVLVCAGKDEDDEYTGITYYGNLISENSDYSEVMFRLTAVNPDDYVDIEYYIVLIDRKGVGVEPESSVKNIMADVDIFSFECLEVTALFSDIIRFVDQYKAIKMTVCLFRRDEDGNRQDLGNAYADLVTFNPDEEFMVFHFMLEYDFGYGYGLFSFNLKLTPNYDEDGEEIEPTVEILPSLVNTTSLGG